MKLKASKSELIILVAILIIGSGILYYKYILGPQLEQIKQLNADIEDAKYRIELKEIELSKVDSLKEEVARLDTSINASKMKIIPYHETAKKLILLEDFIELSNLTLEKIELKEPVEKILGEEKDDANSENASDKDVEKYGEISIHLELFGSYEDLRTFIEQIKASVKPFVINTIEISPREKKEGAQQREDEVQATIELFAYTLLNPLDKTENRNYNFMEYEYEYKNPFKPIENIEDKVDNKLSEVIDEKLSKLDISDFLKEESNVLPPKISDFTIAIKDVYASGDNFYIVGPGNKGDYTTIQTRTIDPVNFYLTLSPTGYEYSIEAEDQSIQSLQKEIPLEKCRVIVDSTVMAIRNNQKLNTGIYIKNNTGYLVDVVLKGNYLDKVHIYTSSGVEVKPGETKENIQVRTTK